ncbi:Protein of unknown function [Gryllus bimaculatus]|nr:Protein of unknown function [Gryllus bimaculatus]
MLCPPSAASAAMQPPHIQSAHIATDSAAPAPPTSLAPSRHSALPGAAAPHPPPRPACSPLLAPALADGPAPRTRNPTPAAALGSPPPLCVCPRRPLPLPPPHPLPLPPPPPPGAGDLPLHAMLPVGADAADCTMACYRYASPHMQPPQQQ